MTAYKYQTKKGIRWEYLCNYTDYDGKKRQKHQQGFSTRREALEAERIFLNTKKFDNETTFGTVVELYKKQRFKDLKGDTVRGCEIALKRFESWMDIPLSQITDEMLQDYVDSFDVNPTSKKRYASYVQVIYAFGAKRCGLPRERIHYSVKLKRREYKIYTLDEYIKFRGCLNEISKVFFDLLYFGGLRRGEAMALNLEDITDVISISKTIDREGVITSPKTETSNRTIALPQFLMDEIREYASSLPDDPKHPLFPVSLSYFQHHHLKAEKEAGLHHIRLHDFRHSHASYLVAQGVNIADISKRLGHSSIGITLNVYAHLYKDKDKDIAEMLNNSVRNP